MVSSQCVTFGPQVCGDLAEGAAREWLVPDGLGGYAMGTVNGLRTRRYHGLLAVAGSHPGKRNIGLIALDPVLRTPSGAEIRLGVHEWTSGSVAPSGHVYLERFQLVDGLPRWRWRFGDLVLERELAMMAGRSALGVVFRLLAGGPVALSAEALCTWRDAHGDRRDLGAPLPVAPVADGVVVDRAYRLAGPGWTGAGLWYEGAHLREEAARGLVADEDVWLAGSFNATLRAGETLECLAWSGDLSDIPPPASTVIARARERAARVIATAGARDEVDATLALAADAFVVSAGSGAGPDSGIGSGIGSGVGSDGGSDGGRLDVVAGYPWFGVWSRDTMTSYDGLFLAVNRFDEGRELLRGYAGALRGGMLANTADTGALEYNTADATLWFLHAIGRHVEVTGDLDLAAALIGDMTGVVAAHLTGVRHGIRVDPSDGLLAQGAPGLALTWMDARVDGRVITPRAGKPVEINALWINGLATVIALGEKLGVDVSMARSAHDRARASFARRFPRGGSAGLFDVVDGPAGDDPAVRPNQLLAYSLPRAPMAGQAPPPALSGLLTPLGLRTLDPSDTAYRGRHRGDQVERDEAYHQGTVWPWLIGPHVDAARRVDPGDRGDGVAGTGPRAGVGDAGDILPLLDGLVAHLGDYGVGSVSETADGDAPHGGTGCPFQAWSVAELLRVRREIGDLSR